MCSATKPSVWSCASHQQHSPMIFPIRVISSVVPVLEFEYAFVPRSPTLDSASRTTIIFTSHVLTFEYNDLPIAASIVVMISRRKRGSGRGERTTTQFDAIDRHAHRNEQITHFPNRKVLSIYFRYRSFIRSIVVLATDNDFRTSLAYPQQLLRVFFACSLAEKCLQSRTKVRTPRKCDALLAHVVQPWQQNSHRC